MATLYVENVPEQLYDSLRALAREHRRSISAEVLTMLDENIPTEAELARREELFQTVSRVRAGQPGSPGPFPSTEEMQREDRVR